MKADPLGRLIRSEYDEDGYLVAETDALGGEQRFVYDEKRQLVASFDETSERTRYKRDFLGRVTMVEQPGGAVTKLFYENTKGKALDQPTRIERPDGTVVSRKFMSEGEVSEETDGEGRTVRYGYAAFDLLETVTDPRGGELRYAYDVMGRLLSVVNPQGRVWRFERDAVGRITGEEDFDARRLAYTYDDGDRLIEKVNADGSRLSYAYDKAGLMLEMQTFPPGEKEAESVTSFAYDDRGLLTEARNDAANIRLERDNCGQIIAECVNGRRIESHFDALGRRIRRLIGAEGSFGADDGFGDGPLAKLSRNMLGPSAGLVEGPGVSTLSQHYDGRGLLSSLKIGDHAPLAFTRDARGLELSRTSASGFHLEQAFDTLGQLSHQKAGGKALERSFDWNRAFEPLSIRDGRWGETRYGYDAGGLVDATSYGDQSREQFRYDPALNITATGALGAAPGQGKAEGAAPVYTMRRGADGQAKAPTSRFVDWQASPGGRVTSAQGPRGEQVRLKHDAQGRVIERRVERTGFRPRIQRLQWNALDQLAAFHPGDGSLWRYGYDPFGRRVFKVRFTRALDADDQALLREAERVDYLWDGDVIAEERRSSPEGGEEVTKWFYEPETFRPLAKHEGKRLSYVVTDHLGTPRELLSEQGQLLWAAEFSTWGQVRRLWQADNDNDDPARGPLQGYDGEGKPVYTTIVHSQGNLALKACTNPDPMFCPIRFQGQWQDEETGLYYNRFRYYDPLSAQYLSPDPIGLLGGFRPQGYVHNPTSWIDPLGLEGVIVIGETQARVDAFAKSIGAKTISQSWPSNFPTGSIPGQPWTSSQFNESLEFNRNWLNKKMNEGYKVIDIGKDPTRTSRSPFYEMEQDEIAKRNYQTTKC